MTPAHLVDANGARIPAIGLGTWKLRGGECARMVAEAIGLGYRHIDTAQAYENEAEVGEGLRAAGLPRDEVFVTTKIWYDQLSPDAARRSLEGSLGRLGLDAVDLALIHWPSPEMTAGEMARSLCALKREGLARHVGVSNFPVGLLEATVAAADAPIVANQCEYHPELDQSRLIDACRRHGVAFVSYAPLGRGDLLENATIREIAAAKGRTAGQVILRWHVQQEGVVAIPKTGSVERARENLDVFDFALDADEMRRVHGLARPEGRRVDPAWAPDWSA